MRERDAFGAVLTTVRARLRGGRFAPGSQLLIGELASELRLSSTPVREALARLAGEGLVEDRRGNGYFARRLDVAEIQELYAMHELLIGSALGRGRDASLLAPPAAQDGPSQERPETPDPVAAVEDAFDAVVDRCGDQVLGDCYAAVRDRLAPVRRAELVILPDAERELNQLVTALAADDPDARGRLADYHHQRRSSAPGLARHLRAQSGRSG